IDTRNAIKIALNDPEWGGWSDSQIAKLCHVDHKTVASVRSSLGNFPSEESPGGSSTRTYTNKHGTIATMNVANIGPGKNGQAPATAPASPAPNADEGDEEDHAPDPEELLDEAGQSLPPQALAAFQQLPEVRKLLKRMDDLVRDIGEMGKSPAGVYMHI